MTTESSAPLPTGLQLTNLDPAFRENPHAVLDALREQDPVHHEKMLDILILTRHADVEAILRDRELCVDMRKAPKDSPMRRLGEGRVQEEREPSMLFLDPPEHDRLRGLVNKAFTPRAVEAIAPRVLVIADELCDAIEGREGFDLIADFSAPLPTIVIAEMLGVDPKDQKRFKAWSDAVVQGLSPFLTEEQRKVVETNGAELDAYIKAAIEDRRAHRGTDLISAMIDAEEDGERMTDAEIVTMTGLLLLAGNLTTTDLIGNGMYAMLSHPEELAKLRARPELLKNTVEEMLRFDPPVMQSGRLTLEERMVSGCPAHAGQNISVSLSGANHDPAVHPDPHRFDIERQGINHVSFGGGRRYCLGAPLARLETQVAVSTLVRRFPNLRLAEATAVHRSMPVFRGLLSLPVLV